MKVVAALKQIQEITALEDEMDSVIAHTQSMLLKLQCLVSFF